MAELARSSSQEREEEVGALAARPLDCARAQRPFELCDAPTPLRRPDERAQLRFLWPLHAAAVWLVGRLRNKQQNSRTHALAILHSVWGAVPTHTISLSPNPSLNAQEKLVETAIKDAEAACDGGSTGECAAAWDNVSVQTLGPLLMTRRRRVCKIQWRLHVHSTSSSTQTQRRA